MNTLWLRLKAPFAAFRWMQAGVWRGTSPVIPPSAAWGLVLNLAGIETRSSEPGVTTLIREDAPAFEVAFASNESAERGSLYQQLHSYPVGNSGKELEALSHGQKYWIAPARRELLVGFDVTVGVRASPDITERVVKGLAGAFEGRRYGLPFAGDNNLLFSSIDVVAHPEPLRWYTPVERAGGMREGSCRLTIGIDRAEASRTTSGLFAPLAEATATPPSNAWVWVPRGPPA